MALPFRSSWQRPAAEIPDGTDKFTKEGLAIEVDGRICSPQAIEVLSRLLSEGGRPKFLR